ncbi:hypothetical protein TGME49_225005 [Toxoplasma gondii ME49]|uniref:Uncharacterized protein n=3 Tax=Toxoplasma gondii TaxID=5811 RepID=A0A086KMG4_TOXGO|nr:hypothetical protein TGME49_225005 [Toxoplasma gondii ME49]EPT27003.1 hypothetical protein TGME49_225005 [Toxoplasma gondii ME49]KFG45582.1 hypothetical protein TGDOM2_225005 [Toxoplasma gondii GAB2-2007-GAL-DOM2]|eukprot:XP_018635972.1 hypothetical protein TGME49_225005 [Toxoplasma gondii ME49]
MSVGDEDAKKDIEASSASRKSSFKEKRKSSGHKQKAHLCIHQKKAVKVRERIERRRDEQKAVVKKRHREVERRDFFLLPEESGLRSFLPFRGFDSWVLTHGTSTQGAWLSIRKRLCSRPRSLCGCVLTEDGLRARRSLSGEA